MWQLRITINQSNKQTNKQQQSATGEQRMLFVMFEFSPEKLMFPKQQEKFTIIAQKLPKKKQIWENLSSLRRNIKVKIAEKEQRLQHFGFQKKWTIVLFNLR